MSETLPRTLLVSWFAPDDRKGGAVIVRSLAKRFGPERLRWFCFSRPEGPLAFPFAQQYAGCCVAPNKGATRLRLGRFWKWYGRHVWCRQAARRVLAAARGWSPEVIWFVLDYNVVAVAAEVARQRPDAVLHVSVHDDPVLTAEHQREPAAEVARVGRDLERLRRRVGSIDAVCEELLAAMDWRARAKAVVTLGCDPAAAAARLTPPRPTGTLVLGVAGNYVGVEELAATARGLDAWSLSAGRDARIVVLGRADLAGLHPRIEAHGYQPPDAVRRRLEAADLLYLPMGLGAGSSQMRTSLPTKLVSYVELGKLILAHAPDDSAAARILREAHLGQVVSTHRSEDVAQAVARLLDWDLARADAGRRRLLEDRFCPDAIYEKFVTALSNCPAVSSDAHPSRPLAASPSK